MAGLDTNLITTTTEKTGCSRLIAAKLDTPAAVLNRCHGPVGTSISTETAAANTTSTVCLLTTTTIWKIGSSITGADTSVVALGWLVVRKPAGITGGMGTKIFQLPETGSLPGCRVNMTHIILVTDCLRSTIARYTAAQVSARAAEAWRDAPLAITAAATIGASATIVPRGTISRITQPPVAQDRARGATITLGHPPAALRDSQVETG